MTAARSPKTTTSSVKVTTCSMASSEPVATRQKVGTRIARPLIPHKRAQAVGRIPILLDVRLYFIHDNAKSWNFQTGWKIVNQFVHGGEADLMELALELAS